jgi:zinc transport system substrate-binding protein
MKKNIISFFIVSVAIFLMAFFFIRHLVVFNNKPQTGSSKTKVITTLFPLYDMARYIGGDKIELTLLLPPGVDPHSFEPKPSDIVKISQADVFVYTGKFMEPWVEDIINATPGKSIKVVDSSYGVKIVPAIFHDADEPAGSLDPHIWLDFDNAKIIVDNITAALVEKDATNGNFYRQNAEQYKSTLSALDNEYKTTLVDCQNQEIIYAGHYAFGYLANRYGLKYLAAQGVSPDAEPTAKDLMKLVDQIKKNRIKYVFYEKLTSPKIAEVIASETDAKMLYLNPAGNLSKEDMESGVRYFEILKENRNNLKLGLGCK